MSEEMRQELNGVKAEMAGLKHSVGVLEASVDALKASVGKLETRVGRLEATTFKLVAASIRHDESFKRLEKKMEKLDALDGLKTTLEKFTSEIIASRKERFLTGKSFGTSAKCSRIMSCA